MSLDPGGLRASSPASSGRAGSPISRLPRHQLEDGVNPKDKAYRRYASGVERALSSFDTTQQEWADYISFLSRLLKSLQAHPPEIHAIPDSQTVATRLSQCLNPTLPSGVHQKALEVYAYVFSTIGPMTLARDLHLYFPGLSSVLSFASLSVRPYFLGLLENYVLHLDPSSLRPALKAIILSLLPGLEDQTSEDFERIVQVLDNFREVLGEKQDGVQEQDAGESRDSYFWQCFFLATVTSPSRRLGALAYLARYLPKFAVKGTDESGGKDSLQDLPAASQAPLSPEPGLLIRCFSAGLSDQQLLVQRGFLDLLVTHLPLDSVVLQQAVPKADLDRLIFAAAGVVSRRDMSLNRRLWAWFLGPEPKNEVEKAGDAEIKSPTVDLSSYHAAYFARHGLRSLTRSILAMLEKKPVSPTERARPFRMCLSLMDRWEVGGLLIPEIFIPAMNNAFEFSQNASTTDADEVIKSASIFFDGVESGLIWAKFLELVTTALETGKTTSQNRARSLELCHFIIKRFNVREEEMVLHHMPLAVLVILTLLNKQAGHSSDGRLVGQAKTLALDLSEKLVNMIPDRAFTQVSNGAKLSNTSSLNSKLNEQDLLRVMKEFYQEDSGLIESSPPLAVGLVSEHTLRQAINLFFETISGPASTSIDFSTRILCSLLQKIPSRSLVLKDVDLLTSLQSALEDAESSKLLHFPVVSAVTTLVVTVQSVTSSSPYISTPELLGLQNDLVRLLWEFLSPHSPKYHVEAVRCLWQLDSISSTSRYVEASITGLLSASVQSSVGQEYTSSADSGRRFAVLWAHSMQEKGSQGEKGQRGVIRRTSSIVGVGSATGYPTDPSTILARPLLILLDSLAEDGTELIAFVKSWVQQLSTLPRVFDIIRAEIQELKCFRVLGNQEKKKPSRIGDSHAAASNDSEQCLYYMKHILRIIKYASEHTWMVIASDMVEPLFLTNDEESNHISLQGLLIQICLHALEIVDGGRLQGNVQLSDLQRTALEIILLLLQGPFSAPLKELELEKPLLERLQKDLNAMEPLLQTALLETITAALKLRSRIVRTPPKPSHQRRFSKDLPAPASGTPVLETPNLSGTTISPSLAPPPALIDCLKAGFSSPSSRITLDSWVSFLAEVLPLFSDTIFQNLIPLVECFCSQLGLVFAHLKSTFRLPSAQQLVSPEPTLISLMNGLEQILARAHDRLVTEELKASSNKSPDQPQSFFGNMVQGVFASETEKPTRTATANNRLAVLLCFQDTVRSCFTIWSWGMYGRSREKQDSASISSFGYTSLRMRNRARRLLEHLFAAEALECLETLAVLFCRPPTSDFQPESVMGLLNVLNGSRPKHTIPAIFNAIYSRTNPTALDPGKMSSLTSELSDTDLVSFLVDYMKSVEDDAMDEIWADCMAFLKDVLANPLPHSQILPLLLDFVALIAEKVDNTNFGEQRKMRKELGDVFLRLLTATFTTRPMGFLQEPSQPAEKSKSQNVTNGNSSNAASPRDFISILSSVVPRLQLILTDSERVSTASASISTNVIGPTIRAKAFPSNIDKSFVELLYQLTKVSQGNKAWRKDVADALNDARFFIMPTDLVQQHWAQILHQLAINDKERMPELLSRLTAPTTAGIVFGVGATSARMEADRKTQLNLRRIALLILSSDEDTFVPNLRMVEEKLVELFTATLTSSPSSGTRSEAFMVLRALVIRTSPVHLAPFWPIINSELQTAILSTLPDSNDQEKYNNASILQACKLLDSLITLDPDDFQPHEWLFITDTIDAVYRPSNYSSIALADEMAEALGNAPLQTPTSAQHNQYLTTVSSNQNMRRPFLDPLLEGLEDEEGANVKLMAKHELASRVLRPFFGQLSIWAFEATYGMVAPDIRACEKGLLMDLFEDGETLQG